VRVEIVGVAVETTTTYEPYGNLLARSGASGTVYGFTGEQHDGATGLVYLRARYYSSGLRGFISADAFVGYATLSISQNPYSYAYNNPINLTDPSGLDPWWCSQQQGFRQQEACYAQYTGQYSCRVPAPGTPGGEWNCRTTSNIRSLKSAFLDSARRHNRIPGMDNNAFAALLVSVIVSEGKMGMASRDSSFQTFLENAASGCGIVVSGHFLKEAFEQRNWSQLYRYAMNQEIPDVQGIPQLATVGIGNIKLDTAANIWKGQACGHPLYSPECTPVQVSTLQTTNVLGMQVNLPNPYAGVACASGGNCVTYERSEIGALQYLATNLLNKAVNIEYVAANLAAGALRAAARGLTPGAFSSATWHMWGVQDRGEVERFPHRPGPYGPMGIVRNIPTALNVLSLRSGWMPDMDGEYVYWRGQGY
jgi:RHS repeat-associated protein